MKQPDLQTPAQSKRILSSRRFTVILSVFNLITILGLSAMVFYLSEQIFKEFDPAVTADLRWKTQRGAQELSHALDLPILVKNIKNIEKELTAFRLDRDVKSIVITDAAGKLIYVHGTPPMPIADLFKGAPKKIYETPTDYMSWSESFIEGMRIGRIALVVSKKRLSQGVQLRRRILAVAGIGCIFALILSLIFVAFYISPLLRLTNQTLKNLQDLNVSLENRVRKRTKDLQRSNQQLQENLERVEQMQSQLIDLSRRSGMAEVATNILHNVGNVLNSVNVSVECMHDSIVKSRVKQLRQTVLLISEHSSNVAEFFSQDPKGKQVPRFLALLSETIEKEFQQLFSEVMSQKDRIDHIKKIISTQQDHARISSNLKEKISLKQIIEEAISANIASYEKYHIDIFREYADVDEIVCDRHKLFQILMNLLSNAKHAIQGANESEKKIILRTRTVDSTNLAIDIIDTGYGIPKENLTQIFTHGFTTKKNGHGFGLHSSAIAAKEIGGSLAAFSDGAGKGSRFTVELPRS